MADRICTTCGRQHRHKATRCRTCCNEESRARIERKEEALREEGRQEERARVVAYTAGVVEAAGKGRAPWPIMKIILEKLQGEFERGEHVTAKAEVK